MATGSQIQLTVATAGVYHVPSIAEQSCKAASHLLQENHDKHHIFFHKDGFHNHIAHHLLTIFALGASADELQTAFDNNKGYQRPLYPINEENVRAMQDYEKWKGFLGKEEYFHDFEAFFKREIEEKGYETVLQERLLARTERSEGLLIRMYAGFYHPIIHLGFGVEFKQPAIIVEALAQAATHSSWIGPFLLNAEKTANASTLLASKSLPQLLHEVRANEKIRNSAHLEDGNKVRDGVLVRAKDEMTDLAAQWRVNPDELERKTAEMISASAYFTGAAQRREKVPKFDFYYMHCINSSLFFSAFLRERWISPEDKCRLLEWKGREDLALYASRAAPELLLDEITEYKAKKADDGWEGVIGRINKFPDDGHASKFIRALANGENVCKQYTDHGDFVIKGDMWLKLAHMVVDSVESDGPNWVRNTGFEEAWKDVPEKAKL